MKIRITPMIIAIAVLSSTAHFAWTQQARPTTQNQGQWYLDITGGWLTGGSYEDTYINGERVKLQTDTGWLAGLRLGWEQEYVGWELSAAGVFHNADRKADPAATVPNVSNVDLLLTDFNLLLYPTGNEWMNGRIRPFITAGPGVAWLTSDFDHSDNELLLDTNAGAGVKFMLGQKGDPELRLDWRWHYLFGFGDGVKNSIYRQELTLAIGFHF